MILKSWIKYLTFLKTIKNFSMSGLDHTHKHVFEELQNYSKLVSKIHI